VTAVVLAALSALFFGLAAAAQHHATQQVDRHTVLHPGLVLALARRPWWLLGVSASVVGVSLQVAALAAGSIIVVQTLIVSSLLWTSLGESVLARRRPEPRALAGVGLAVLGIVGLLLVLDPRAVSDPHPPTVAAGVQLVGGCAVLAAVGLAWSARTTGPARALGLALTAGTVYGLTAALFKIVTGESGAGWTAPLGRPTLYVACLLGAAAVLLNQNALQQGRRASPGIAVVLLVDPAVGLAAGVLWFDERLTLTAWTLAAAAACLAVTVGGVALAHRTAADTGAGTGRIPLPRRALRATDEVR
jgi:drug/metabolite transporter (DMT)-like permease